MPIILFISQSNPQLQIHVALLWVLVHWLTDLMDKTFGCDFAKCLQPLLHWIVPSTPCCCSWVVAAEQQAEAATAEHSLVCDWRRRQIPDFFQRRNIDTDPSPFHLPTVPKLFGSMYPSEIVVLVWDYESMYPYGTILRSVALNKRHNFTYIVSSCICEFVAFI